MAQKKVSPSQADRPASVTVGEHGYALGLAGFITSIFVGVVGLVLSAVALHQSRSVGKRNSFARAGLIIGIVRTVLDVLFIVGGMIALISFAEYCNNHPNTNSCSESDSSTSRPYYDPTNSDSTTTSPSQTY